MVSHQQKHATKPFNQNHYKYLSLIVLTIQNAALALSMRYSRIRSGDMFYSTTAVLMSEFIKLLICIVFSYLEYLSMKKFLDNLKYVFFDNYIETLKVAVPAFIYVVQNNLLYLSASNLDAATYQITYQLKILTTAIFAILILRRKLIKTQWIALMLLVIGIVLVQLSNQTEQLAKKANITQNRTVGFLAALSACILSGFAGIYFEKILKESVISLWTRNIQLSILSLPFAIGSCFISDYSNIAKNGFFFGYDLFIFYVVCLNAGGGLIVAVVVKYADNILKGFATSLAIVLACFGSIYFFDFKISTQFFIGVTFVISSIFLYGYQPKQVKKTLI